MDFLIKLKTIVELLEEITFGRLNYDSDNFYRFYSYFEGILEKSELNSANLEEFKKLQEKGYECLGWHQSLERFF